MWPEHTLELHMRMVKKSNGKEIDSSALVAPVNNVILDIPWRKYVTNKKWLTFSGCGFHVRISSNLP